MCMVTRVMITPLLSPPPPPSEADLGKKLRDRNGRWWKQYTWHRGWRVREQVVYIHIYRHTRTHSHTRTYIYIYIERERERERERGQCEYIMGKS